MSDPERSAKMKRPLKLLIAGLIVLVLGFFAIPPVFENWYQRPSVKHTQVQSSEKKVVHIATSNPNISVMVYESEGRSIVVVTQTSSASSSQVMLETDEKQGVQTVNQFHKDKDGITILDRPDKNGIPTRKMIKHSNIHQSFLLTNVEWKPIVKNQPNQSPEPTTMAVTPPATQGSLQP